MKAIPGCVSPGVRIGFTWIFADLQGLLGYEMSALDLPPLIVPPSELDFLLFFEPMPVGFADMVLLSLEQGGYTLGNCAA
jgi:hypothetical protein